MGAPALDARGRQRPQWRWTRPFALLPLLVGVLMACGVLQLALRCCS